MKKQKNVLLFGVVCLLLVGAVLVTNMNLTHILPDYKELPRQVDVTYAKTPVSANQEQEGGWHQPPPARDAASFFFKVPNYMATLESAEETVGRAQDSVPKACIQLLERLGYTKTMVSSQRKMINDKRYFYITLQLQKDNDVRPASFVYAEDETAIFYYEVTAAGRQLFQGNAQVTDKNERNKIIAACKGLLNSADTAISVLAAFAPTAVWRGGESTKASDVYLLWDEINHITVEYNEKKQEILSFSIQK